MVSPTLLTRLCVLVIALGALPPLQAEGPRGLALETGSVTPAFVGLGPDGAPADTTILATWNVPAIVGLAAQGGGNDEKHTFHLRQILCVEDASGTVVRRIPTDTVCTPPAPGDDLRVVVTTVWDGLDDSGASREGTFRFAAVADLERHDVKLKGGNEGYLTVLVIDHAEADLPGTVTCDFTAPQILITNPVDGSVVDDPAQNLVGRVVASDLPTLATLVVNGQTVVPAADGSFSQPVTLAEGLNTLTVTATDVAGNIGAMTISVSLNLTGDHQPPAITNLNPAAGTWLNTGQVTVAGLVTDDVGVASVLVNGLPVTLAPDGTFSTFVPLPIEGPVLVTIEARDQAGNTASLAHPLFVDRTAPVVTISSPIDGAIVNEPAQTITGMVVETGLSTLVVNGQIVVPAADGSFSMPITLNAGTTTVTAVATDLAGNQSTASVTLRLDTQPPVISGLTPAADSWLNTSDVTVAGLVTDDVGVGSVLVDGLPVTLAPDGTFSTFVPLPIEGPVLVTIEARDQAGNTASLVLPLFVDRTAPVLTISSPTDGAIVNEPAQTITGVVVETGLSTLVVNGQIVVPAADGSFSLPITLDAGTTTVTAVATDLAGNQSTAGVTLSLDTQPPTISALSPPANSWLSTSDVTVSGLVTDDVGVASVLVNGQPVVPAADGTFSTFVPLPIEGPVLVTIEARDLAGNIATLAHPLLADRTPPVVTISSPTDGATVGATVSVSGRVTEDHLVSLTLNEHAVSPAADGSFGPIDLPVTGEVFTIHATALDLAGNSGEDVVTVLRGADLSVAITSHTEGQFIAAVSVELRGTVVGLNGGTVTANGTPCTVDAEQWWVSYELPQEGTNEILVVASPPEGASASTTMSLVRDTEGPVLVVIEPEDGAVVGQQVSVRGTVTDAVSGVSMVTVNGTPASIQGGSFSLDLSLDASPMQVTISAIDPVQNESHVIRTVTFNAPPPTLTLLEPVDGLVTNASSVTVRGTINAAAGLSLTVQDEAVVVTDGSFQTTLALPEGDTAVSVRAVDVIGREAVAEASVVVDRTAPVLVDLAPASGTWLSAPSCLVSGRAVDSRGVTSVSVALVQADVLPDGAFAAVVPLALEGNNAIQITARDEAGNAASTTLVLRRDTVLPWSDLEPVDGSVGLPGTFTASALFGDDLSGVEPSGVRLLVDGSDVTETASIFANSLTWHAGGLNQLSGGAHVLELRVSDRAGNVVSLASSVTVDAPPLPPALLDVSVGKRMFCPGSSAYGPPGLAQCTVSFSLTGPGYVSLTARDLDGAVQATRTTLALPKGSGQVVWDGLDDDGHFLPAGIYVLEVRAHGDGALVSNPATLNVRIVY